MQLIIFCRVPRAASISSLRSICPSELWQQIWHSIFRVSELPAELISGKKLQRDRRGRRRKVSPLWWREWIAGRLLLFVKRLEYPSVLGSSGRKKKKKKKIIVQIFTSRTTYNLESWLQCSCTTVGDKTWNQLVETQECVSHWCYRAAPDSPLLSICESLNHKCTTREGPHGDRIPHYENNNRAKAQCNPVL